MTVERYAVPLTVVRDGDQPGRVMARIMPYGQTIDRPDGKHSYGRGSISLPDRVVPVTVDHGDGVVDRIGRLVVDDDRDDGFYGELQLSDTALGRDVRTLLVDGVITDVSAGIEVNQAKVKMAKGVKAMAGVLDHVAIVTRGAFGGPRGSRVLSAYTEEQEMPESEPVEVTTEPAAEPANYATKDDFDRLERLVAASQVPAADRPSERPGNFRNLHDYMLTQVRARQGDPRAAQRLQTYQQAVAPKVEGLAEYALADDTTTTAAGLVPDYLSSDIIGLINDFRPFVDSVPSDPVGPYGMSVVYPEVKVKPDVGVQATEKTEVTTQAMDIDPKSVDLVTYAGASDVSLQLVERSQPSFVDRLFAELAGVYAERTDAAAIAAATAAAVAAGNTAILANAGTSAAATWAAIAVGVADIAASVKRPADTLWVAADRFGQLITLVDSDGRPLLTPSGTNAQGTGDFTTFTFRYGGLRVIVDPHAAAGTMLLGWSQAVATLELQPQQLRALQVDLLGLNVGVWGLFATVVKYPTGLYALTAA